MRVLILLITIMLFSDCILDETITCESKTNIVIINNLQEKVSLYVSSLPFNEMNVSYLPDTLYPSFIDSCVFNTSDFQVNSCDCRSYYIEVSMEISDSLILQKKIYHYGVDTDYPMSLNWDDSDNPYIFNDTILIN